VIALFGDALIAGRPVTIFGDGSSTRDYVYVDDVVDAFVRAGAAPLGAVGTFNIGTGKQASVLELHGLIADAVGAESEPQFMAARTGELDAIALDATRAGVELGWSAATELAEGIDRTIQWLRTIAGDAPAGSVT
jgi:UDP-glucose 4-epimerase